MELSANQSVECKACGAQTLRGEKPPRFCVQCGAMFPNKEETTLGEPISSEASLVEGIRQVSLSDEGVPALDKVRFELGSYQVLETIGIGGMGEVYLAFDKICGRRVAFKRIRSDLQTIKKLHSRFLREARLTSQLTHPAIISIYAIHQEDNLLYYTMPYVEGHTLKQILRRAGRQMRRGEAIDGLAASIPSLIRIFLSVCHAIAYAHFRGVLHRDIKPENVIVGQYGQITILDWGLAKLIGDSDPLDDDDMLSEEEAEQLSTPSVELTMPGKIVGTVSYLAPERAHKEPASVQTEIFALGVMLYQLLTLRLPFDRKGLKGFRKHVDKEVVPEPSQVAPYRDISQSLTNIVKKCLVADQSERYRNVDALIHDLEGYMEGRSDWLGMKRLDPFRKSDWEFQENVLLTENLAIARHMEVTTWVNLMLSKATLPENIKLEARVRLGEKSSGVGILFSVPEGARRSHLSEGYCLWLAPEGRDSSALYRSGIEVMSLKRCYLTPGKWYQIQIEKVENRIHLQIGDAQQVTYNSHLPLAGSHVGIMTRDGDYQIERMAIYGGTLSIRVSRLAIPDAFLNAKDYEKALEEYRNIGENFPGRQEGREAMFRAGYTLLEWGRQTQENEKREALFDRALDEFDKLHHTPGAPLQYLGKSLVYKTLGDAQEEINCLELGYRRYRHHPMVDVLEEQILYRMHDSSRLDRHATYRFALLAIQFNLSVTASPNSKRLFATIQKHWEMLPFIIDSHDRLNFAVQLAYWLAKPYAVRELLETLLAEEKSSHTTIGNALFSLLELGGYEMAREMSKGFEGGEEIITPMLPALHVDEKPLGECVDLFLESLPAQVTAPYCRTLWHLLHKLRLTCNYQGIRDIAKSLELHQIDAESRLVIESHTIWSYLLEGRGEAAGRLLQSYSRDQLYRETSPLAFLYGCWLAMEKGVGAARDFFVTFSGSPYPRTSALLGNFITGKIGLKGEWFDNAFSWEKRQLYSQLTLYSYCTGRKDLAERYHHLEVKESSQIRT